jgi:hypothetical protein
VWPIEVGPAPGRIRGRARQALSGLGRRRDSAPTVGLGHGAMFAPGVGAGCTGDPRHPRGRPCGPGSPKGFGSYRGASPHFSPGIVARPCKRA